MYLLPKNYISVVIFSIYLYPFKVRSLEDWRPQRHTTKAHRNSSWTLQQYPQWSGGLDHVSYENEHVYWTTQTIHSERQQYPPGSDGLDHVSYEHQHVYWTTQTIQCEQTQYPQWSDGLDHVSYSLHHINNSNLHAVLTCSKIKQNPV